MAAIERGPILLDTGPIVALFNAKDRHHAWAKSLLGQLRPPLFTCEAVLSEASFLLGRVQAGSTHALELLRRGVVSIGLRLDDESDAITRLMARYANIPMSLADACLVRMAETRSRGIVMTIDRDFLLYRIHGRKRIPVLMPDDV